jgi:hypothetical protein
MQKLPRQRRKVHFLETEPLSTSSSPPPPPIPAPLLLLKLIFSLRPSLSFPITPIPSLRPRGPLPLSPQHPQGPTAAPPSPRRPHDRTPGTPRNGPSSRCRRSSRPRFCQEQVSTFLLPPPLPLPPDSLAPGAQLLHLLLLPRRPLPTGWCLWGEAEARRRKKARPGEGGTRRPNCAPARAHAGVESGGGKGSLARACPVDPSLWSALPRSGHGDLFGTVPRRPLDPVRSFPAGRPGG